MSEPTIIEVPDIEVSPRSRRNASKPKPEVPADDRVYTPSVDVGGPRLQRISIALNEDGSIDMSRMRGDSKARLKEALQRPDVSAELLGRAPAPLFSDSDIATLLDGVSQIEQLIAKLLLRIPSDIASDCFAFSPLDKAMITPPAQGLLAKYAPAMLSANKDLIAFALIFTGIVRRQFDTAMMLQRERMEQLRKTAGAPPASEPIQ